MTTLFVRHPLILTHKILIPPLTKRRKYNIRPMLSRWGIILNFSQILSLSFQLLIYTAVRIICKCRLHMLSYVSVDYICTAWVVSTRGVAVKTALCSATFVFPLGRDRGLFIPFYFNRLLLIFTFKLSLF